MSPVIKFYQKLTKLFHVERQNSRLELMIEALKIAEQCKDKITLPLDQEWLTAAVYHSDDRRNNPQWTDISDSIAQAAFLDLSLVRDTYAMKAFRDIAHVLDKNCEMFVFASKLTRRERGRSAIITIHVSDLREWELRLEAAGIEPLILDDTVVQHCRQTPFRRV